MVSGPDVPTGLSLSPEGTESTFAVAGVSASRPRVGLSLVTCDRPDYFRQSFEACLRLPVDVFIVVDDGREPCASTDYLAEAVRAAGRRSITVEATASARSGVGIAKNQGFKMLLAAGCDWLFIAEDDAVPVDSRAITGYLEACEKSGFSHLCWGPHGPANQTPIRSEGVLDIYPNIVGAWCVYSRECLEDVGLTDPVLGALNAMEHVEHTVRLMQNGYTYRWPGCADAAGGRDWVREIEGSIENTSIPFEGRAERIALAMQRFREINEEGFHLLWPGR